MPIRRGRPGLQDMVERPEATARVVEDAVQHDPHAPVVGRIQQLAQRVVATQQGIHREVVVGVIAMVGGGREDGRQVDRRDAQVIQVRQVLGDAEQVAALEAVRRRRAVPWFELPGLDDPLGRREPVREDLVEDGVADPGRRVDRHPQSCITVDHGPESDCLVSGARRSPTTSASAAPATPARIRWRETRPLS